MYNKGDKVEWVSQRENAVAPRERFGVVVGEKAGFVLVQFGEQKYNTTRPCQYEDIKLREVEDAESSD